jgi:hypothetical protein
MYRTGGQVNAAWTRVGLDWFSSATTFSMHLYGGVESWVTVSGGLV